MQVEFRRALLDPRAVATAEEVLKEVRSALRLLTHMAGRNVADAFPDAIAHVLRATSHTSVPVPLPSPQQTMHLALGTPGEIGPPHTFILNSSFQLNMCVCLFVSVC